MSTVGLADIDAALKKVRAFVTVIDQNYEAWRQSSVYDRPTPQQKYTDIVPETYSRIPDPRIQAEQTHELSGRILML